MYCESGFRILIREPKVPFSIPPKSLFLPFESNFQGHLNTRALEHKSSRAQEHENSRALEDQGDQKSKTAKSAKSVVLPTSLMFFLKKKTIQSSVWHRGALGVRCIQ